MAGLKTEATTESVSAFLNSIEDRKKRSVCRVVSNMMREANGKKAKMWGSSIVGFGCYDYRYASGHEGSWPLVGFSTRARSRSLYIMPGFSKFDRLMRQPGKYKTGKFCLHIKSLDGVDRKWLKALIEGSVK